MTQTQQQQHTLTVRRSYPAARERLFEAWTDPEIMRKWFSPEGLTNPAVDVDLRVGGAYRIEMLGPDGRRPVAIGTYKEVTHPERLVFTWGWEEASDEAHTGETVVTVEFFDQDGNTEVVITHGGFATEDACTGHEQGWTSTLEGLARVI